MQTFIGSLAMRLGGKVVVDGEIANGWVFAIRVIFYGSLARQPIAKFVAGHKLLVRWKHTGIS
jgi:hypothetical protein